MNGLGHTLKIALVDWARATLPSVGEANRVVARARKRRISEVVPTFLIPSIPAVC